MESLPFEIIEIGAVKLDETFQQVSEFHAFVKPQVYEQIHYKIAEVTHLTMQELRRDGRPFETAAADFLAWCESRGGETVPYMFCTWGNSDLLELQRNLDYFGVESPLETPLYYYDIQKLYGIHCGDEKAKPSLDRAVEELGLSEDRPFHRALDDAYYTGRVLQKVDFERVKAYLSLDYYHLPHSLQEEIYMEFPTYSKYVSRCFPTKEEALADKTVTDVMCKDCHRMLRKKIRWFSVSHRQYLCLAVCPEHGLVRAKLRIRKGEQDQCYVVKTIKRTDEAGAREICQKKEEQKQKRKERMKGKKKRRG